MVRIFWLCFLPSLVAAARRKAVPVGPKTISTDASGKQIWELDDGKTIKTFEVRDYGVLAPTMVYNCAYMPAICQNIKNRWGSLPKAGSEMAFQRDLDPSRTGQRRRNVCPPTWIKDRSRAGRPCPESDQPKWSGYGDVSDAATKQGPFDAILSQKLNKNGNPSTTLNRLATYEYVTSVDENNMPKVEQVWTELGAVLSCEEFPAASFIQGGAASGGHSAASTYCAPIGKSCSVAKLSHIFTDQDFQAKAHQHLKLYFTYIGGYGKDAAAATAQKLNRERNPLKYTIFTFRFYTVDDKDSKYASWIEANGRKRYCHGPGLDGDGQNPGCSRELDGNDPAPLNP